MPPDVRCYEGGRDGLYDVAHSAEIEYGHAVNCYAADYRALLGGSIMARGAGGKAVVVTGGGGPS